MLLNRTRLCPVRQEPDMNSEWNAESVKRFPEKDRFGPGTATHVVIGLGVEYNGKIERLPVPDAAHEPDTCPEHSYIREIPENLVFSQFDLPDRVPDRIQTKITRRDQRIIKPDEWRRSQ